MVLFKMSRLPDALKMLFRFRVAIIAITPDNAYLLHTPLQNKYQTVCIMFPRT